MNYLLNSNHNWSKQTLYNGPEKVKKLQWQVDFKNTITRSSPVIDQDGNIYFGTNNGELFSLDREGQTRWSRMFGEGFISSPVIDSQGYLFIVLGKGSGGNSLYKLDLLGNEQWNYHNNEGSHFAPLLPDNDGNIYLTNESSINKIDRSGHLVWNFSSRNISSSLITDSRGNLYFSTREGNEAVISLSSDGEVRWSKEIGHCYELYEPVIDSSENVYFMATERNNHNHSMYSFDTDGNVRWKFTPGDRGIISSPALSKEGYLVFGTTFFKMMAIDLSGKLMWETDIGQVTQFTPILDAQNRVYFYTQEKKRKTTSNLWILNHEGDLKWNFQIKGAINWFHFNPVNGLLVRTIDSDTYLLKLMSYDILTISDTD